MRTNEAKVGNEMTWFDPCHFRLALSKVRNNRYESAVCSDCATCLPSDALSGNRYERQTAWLLDKTPPPIVTVVLDCIQGLLENFVVIYFYTRV